jgi:hypothetical protein
MARRHRQPPLPSASMPNGCWRAGAEPRARRGCNREKSWRPAQNSSSAGESGRSRRIAAPGLSQCRLGNLCDTESKGREVGDGSSCQTNVDLHLVSRDVGSAWSNSRAPRALSVSLLKRSCGPPALDGKGRPGSHARANQRGDRGAESCRKQSSSKGRQRQPRTQRR